MPEGPPKAAKKEKKVQPPFTPEANEDDRGWKIVSNEELGVTYREKIIELPLHRQEETGIKRIRRRELLPPFPDGLFRNDTETDTVDNNSSRPGTDMRKVVVASGPRFEFEGKSFPIYEFLSDGKFPSFERWTHTFAAMKIPYMYHRGDKFDDALTYIQQMKDEGLYFQKVLTPNNGVTKSTSHRDSFRLDKNGRLRRLQDSGSPSEYEYADLNLYPGKKVWNTIQGPVFAFGQDNAVFREYIENILENKEVQQMLKSEGWIDKPVEVIEPSSSKYHDSFKVSSYERSYLTPRMLDGHARFKANEEEKARAANLVVLKKPNHSLTNLDLLRQLIQGVRAYTDPVEERRIPLIVHPNIRPLRWCHADVAIIPTRRSLNVLFFDTD